MIIMHKINLKKKFNFFLDFQIEIKPSTNGSWKYAFEGTVVTNGMTFRKLKIIVLSNSYFLLKSEHFGHVNLFANF